MKANSLSLNMKANILGRNMKSKDIKSVYGKVFGKVFAVK